MVDGPERDITDGEIHASAGEDLAVPAHGVDPWAATADWTLAVNLTMAERDREAVRKWWRACDDAGLSSLGVTATNQEPHVTLAVAEGPGPDKLFDLLERELAGTGGPTMLLAHFGVFVQPGNVLFLGVTPTDELRFVQRQVIDTAAAAGFAVWEHYRPGVWVPHCTLARGFDQIGDLEPLLAADLGYLPAVPLLVHTTAVQVAELPGGVEVGRVPLL